MIITFVTEKELFRSGVHIAIQNNALLINFHTKFSYFFFLGKLLFALHKYWLSLSRCGESYNSEKNTFNYLCLACIKELRNLELKYSNQSIENPSCLINLVWYVSCYQKTPVCWFISFCCINFTLNI